MTAPPVENPIAPGAHVSVPDWCSKPPFGSHMDVMKGDKVIQKIMVDERKYYVFGRVAKEVDVAIEHASCSRYHAALIYHQHMQRYFLVDLESTHGTYIGEGKGEVRLEPNVLTHLPMDQVFHFGASTRRFRMRPPMEKKEETKSGDSFVPESAQLPETDDALDELTNYNTQLNRRIAAIDVDVEKKRTPRKRRNVTFDEQEHIINPEDIDPNIGRFQSMVETTIIPTKRLRQSGGTAGLPSDFFDTSKQANVSNTSADMHEPSHISTFGPLSAQLSADLLMTAPDVETLQNVIKPTQPTYSARTRPLDDDGLDRTLDHRPHKKYAKEAWPGQHPHPRPV